MEFDLIITMCMCLKYVHLLIWIKFVFLSFEVMSKQLTHGTALGPFAMYCVPSVFTEVSASILFVI